MRTIASEPADSGGVTQNGEQNQDLDQTLKHLRFAEMDTKPDAWLPSFSPAFEAESSAGSPTTLVDTPVRPIYQVFERRRSSGRVSERRPSIVPDRHSDGTRKWWKFSLREWDEGEEESWWFASTAIPLLAATIGPLANVLSIAALVTYWQVGANVGFLEPPRTMPVPAKPVQAIWWLHFKAKPIKIRTGASPSTP
ncbi:Potassium channel [Elasticomyces elasticus]|nr:Potassium channel [Elasticomyces elasticus]